MSIPDIYGNGQQAEQAIQAEGYHPHLADLFRIRQMDRLLRHTLEELDTVKARLTLLEKEMANREPVSKNMEITKDFQQQEIEMAAPPLPIAEIKQLAEMAKKFR